ncbi:hypothetical protein SL053_002150 [Flavobacterium psychrophilum]|nr:hypothetical protein [Flavobacterium psychrophilum]
MQPNKIIISLFLFFVSNLTHAQPGMKKICNDPRVIFTIKDVNNKKIEFITKDSLNFYSKDNKYSFFLSMKEVRYKLSNTKLDSITRNGKICFARCPWLTNNEPHFTRYSENLKKDKYAFRLVYGVSQRERESEPPYFYEYKSIVDINIKYKNKKMLLRLNFTKNLEKPFEEKKIDLVINFKQGNFEITNPEIPKIQTIYNIH